MPDQVRMNRLRKQKADELVKQYKTLVLILRNRMKWHLEACDAAKDEHEQKIHSELVLQDEEKLEVEKQAYEKVREQYKKHNFDMLEIDFSISCG